MNASRKVFTWLCTLALISSFLIANKQARAAMNWYVAPGGNDNNNCSSPDAPCATLSGALQKSADGDTILVATSTYTSNGPHVLRINKSVTLSGGWNPSFTSRTGISTVDGENARQVIWINDYKTVWIEYFIIENGLTIDTGGAGIINFGTLTLSHSIVQNNTGGDYCWGGGITNYWALTVHWSTIQNNKCTYAGYGGGIFNWNGGNGLTVVNSTIKGNQSGAGGGIYNMSKPLWIINSTISGNQAYTGGGLHIAGGTVGINSTTIANNEGVTFGGGIYADEHWADVTLNNSLLAGNTSNVGIDCWGPINSSGYNLIQDVSGCSFASQPSDQTSIDPFLGPLQDNGGPTETHWLYGGSPAIDGGNPGGCTDHQGNPLATDQRGYDRIQDGDEDGNPICDVGAFEAEPGAPPPPPGSTWYVANTGDDSNDCLSPGTPCFSIAAAVAKANSNDTIKIASGTYTGNGSEVVLIDKNLTLLGGWDATFNSQNGTSIIDGGSSQRGVKIADSLVTRIDRFTIQHGNETLEGGGGIFLDYRSRLTLENSQVQDNQGSGIRIGNFTVLILNNSRVTGNSSPGKGGGISSEEATITLNKSLIADNTANSDGGGIMTWGSLTISDSTISGNTSSGISSRGGGIFNQNGKTKMINSAVVGNSCDEQGGGIYGNDMDLENSLIAGNVAYNGGGIYTTQITLDRTTIQGNLAEESGGGIYNGGKVVMTNSTISGNVANEDGGGIFAGQILSYNTTVSGNSALGSGGGIYSYAQPLIFQNTILAKNGANVAPECFGTVTSNGYNLIGNVAGCTYQSGPGDLINVDARIGRPFGWNGVLTLMPDSPAIDAGDPTGCKDPNGDPLVEDQLGTARPLDGNQDSTSVCDIGSFEYDPDHPIQWISLPAILKFTSGTLGAGSH